MTPEIKRLSGSPKRDLFKKKHKTELPGSFWACDIDFVLIEKHPTPTIIAVLDYKDEYDDITFAEVIAYNSFIQRGIDVYIVCGDSETGSFKISRYVGGHHGRPDYELQIDTITHSWDDFEKWELRLRIRAKDRFRRKESPR